MHLSIEGPVPQQQRLDAMQRGLQAMGVPDVEVIITHDFDATVRRLLGSAAYSSDRGTGTVGAKTFNMSGGPVVVVNSLALQHVNDDALERLLAHESGHVLIDSRGETVEGRHHLAAQEWQWWLLCMGGFAMHEARCERSVAELGYPFSDSSSSRHVAEVLHASMVDLQLLLTDPASADVSHLMHGVLEVVDRLTKVLAYTAADVLHTGRAVDLAAEGPSAQADWDDLVAPSWPERLALYATLPTATEQLDLAMWDQALTAGLALEASLLSHVGFEFEPGHQGFGFYRRISDDVCSERLQRAVAQARFYEAQEPDAKV
jgi:hypothetical protein